MTVLDTLDFICAVGFFVILTIIDRERRKGLTDEELKEFMRLASDVQERSIATTVAARVIQSGLTVGGFLFGGLFAALFQAALHPYRFDVAIAMGWTSASLVFGAINMAFLPMQSVVSNVTVTTRFARLTVAQLAAILGAFIRLFVIVMKYVRV